MKRVAYLLPQGVDLGMWFLEGDGSNFPRNSVTDWVEFDLVLIVQQ
ncbi:hypothetical protein J4727_03375 [Providencia rettgeri]|uniref:Uncharacterized protein n=1 Tax=Providencia rettgeri TaxID=587 RepID=A0A939NA69_PRORE|nr:hypothetical protein [Providencia rettgeri]